MKGKKQRAEHEDMIGKERGLDEKERPMTRKIVGLSAFGHI